MSIPRPTTVHVCRKCKAHGPLAERLAATDGVAVELVRCQDVCKGAVALLEVDGTWTTFRRLRSGKQRKALAKLAGRGGHGPLPHRLEELVVVRRTGRPPKPPKAPKTPKVRTSSGGAGAPTTPMPAAPPVRGAGGSATG